MFKDCVEEENDLHDDECFHDDLINLQNVGAIDFPNHSKHFEFKQYHKLYVNTHFHTNYL